MNNKHLTTQAKRQPSEKTTTRASGTECDNGCSLERMVRRFFQLPNKLINLKNLNYIEKDPKHEIYRMYFRDGLVAPLTTDEFQIMNGSNPVQTHFCMSDKGTVNSVPSESLNK